MAKKSIKPSKESKDVLDMSDSELRAEIETLTEQSQSEGVTANVLNRLGVCRSALEQLARHKTELASKQPAAEPTKPVVE